MGKYFDIILCSLTEPCITRQSQTNHTKCLSPNTGLCWTPSLEMEHNLQTTIQNLPKAFKIHIFSASWAYPEFFFTNHRFWTIILQIQKYNSIVLNNCWIYKTMLKEGVAWSPKHPKPLGTLLIRMCKWRVAIRL